MCVRLHPTVGHAFVHQYYHILHQSPELVYRFYQEDSRLDRPGTDGTVSSVSTLDAINEKIVSMDYHGVKAKIISIDAQESHNKGVLVLVTGYLTGKDSLRRHFTQSFFLATQDKGYYVLNDIFRYIKEANEQQETHGSENGVSDAPPLAHEQQVNGKSVINTVEDETNEVEVYNPPQNGEGLVVEEEVPDDEVINEAPVTMQAVTADSSSAIAASTAAHEEAPKKSYASIVKVMKENPAPISTPIPTSTRPAPLNAEKVAPAPTPAPAKDNSSVSLNAAETYNTQETEDDGYSIYIKNLPLNATPAQLEEQFKKFGPIKPGGIQVRSHKQQGFCYGFVEFEVAIAVQSAIEASPVMIGGRQAYVEEKRPTASRVSSRGRFTSRGGGFRNEGGRGRGPYGGGRGYGRGITIAVLILATEVQAVVDLPTVLVVIVGIKESTMACQMVLKETVLVMRSLETPLLRCPLQLD
uniref:G3BP-like protein n=1 Tax=Ananas comosus var. bracteatus TaxID=296719 RepID=A0A6V7Q7A7_ANACO|nr:unnamed protein product [Ananas comosus var. bracteatus]